MNIKQQATIHHPQHHQIRQSIRRWFRKPEVSSGSAATLRQWGTYWEHGHVFPKPLSAEELPDFLTDLNGFYEHRQTAQIVMDKAEMACTLETNLAKTGWRRNADKVFLVHVGVFPGFPSIPGLSISPINEANLADSARVRLQAFTSESTIPSSKQLEKEIDRLRAEMHGQGQGLLASVDGEAVGMLWSIEEAHDVWVKLVGVRHPFRQRGIAHCLLKHRVASAYSRGFRSVVIHACVDNAVALDLFGKLGFRDEVYRQWRYQKELGTNSYMMIPEEQSFPAPLS